MNEATKQPGLSSEARSAILVQHDHLRRLAAEVSELVHLGMTSEHAIEPLRAKARRLSSDLEEHMQFEEGVLEEALRDVLGRGAELHSEIVQDHQRQRGVLASAIAELGRTGLSSEGLVQSIRRFADGLLREMDAEEQTFLGADVDALLADSEGG